MNEDRMAGAARDWVGKAEHGLGDTVGSDRLRSDGRVDQATGTIQRGYGVVKDAVAGAIEDAPGAVAVALNQSRNLVRKGDEAVRKQLRDIGPLYFLASAVAVFAIGTFALARSSPAKPAAKSRVSSHN